MKTSCYTGYRQADGTLGPGAVRITVGAPRIRKSQYREYLALAPPRPMFEAGYTHADFAGRVLAPLDAATVWQELHALVAPHEPVLLCFEKPEDILAGKTWCHRHMVAEWFAAELGEQVAERGHEAQTALFIEAARTGGLRETYASARRTDAAAPPAANA